MLAVRGVSRQRQRQRRERLGNARAVDDRGGDDRRRHRRRVLERQGTIHLRRPRLGLGHEPAASRSGIAGAGARRSEARRHRQRRLRRTRIGHQPRRDDAGRDRDADRHDRLRHAPAGDGVRGEDCRPRADGRGQGQLRRDEPGGDRGPAIARRQRQRQRRRDGSHRRPVGADHACSAHLRRAGLARAVAARQRADRRRRRRRALRSRSGRPAASPAQGTRRHP